ncbi:MAG: hypothetical protein EA398_04675 [Deltaproteobacteria bacterium]|nr:MAG: hypothetical protein EA398_04675 [Deltaproteobacteria bacterium]
MDDFAALWALELVSPGELRAWRRRCASVEEAIAMATESGCLPGRLGRALAVRGGCLDVLLGEGRQRLEADLARVSLPEVALRDAENDGVLEKAGMPGPFGVVAGVAELPPGPRLAIVGTRHLPPGEALRAREWIDNLLSQVACTVVSGGAYGIDSLAHQAALAHGRPMIVVLAGGLVHAGPAGSREALFRIAGSGGAVLSAWPPGRAPMPAMFVERNRHIAALADAVLVVRAPARSGALGTAREAMRLRRAVAAVPGPLEADCFRGCHALIRSGATLVESARHVRDLLGSGADSTQSSLLPMMARTARQLPTDPVERRLWAILDGRGGVTLDALLLELPGIQPGGLHAALLSMELSGHVVMEPGGHVRAVER